MGQSPALLLHSLPPGGSGWWAEGWAYLFGDSEESGMEEEPSLEGPWWYLASALRQCLGTLGGAIAVFVLGSDRVAALTGSYPPPVTLSPP